MFDLGLAPLALIAVFAIAVGDAVAEAPSRRWVPFGRGPALSATSR
jgi:hypothetical protein